MMHDENCNCGCKGGEENGHHFHGPMKKEFKLALLEKKEKMLRAELEFIEKMKELAKKMPDEK